MKKKEKFTYDFVMLSRFNIALLSPFEFTTLPKNKFIVSHWNDRLQKNNHQMGFYDMWFIANTYIFNEYINQMGFVDFRLSQPVYWKKVLNRTKFTNVFYYKYVGKDYEMTRRLYFEGEGKVEGHYPKNFEKLYII